MKKIAPLLALALAIFKFLAAQGYQNEKIDYLDAEAKPAKEKKAILLKQVVQLADTVWEINFYLKNGPRLKSYRSRDAIGSLLNGQYISYNNGRADTMGNYENGLRAGHWNILILYRSVEYSIDHEALRIIFISPDWTPAVQNGRNVKTYKKQPIIFRLG